MSKVIVHHAFELRKAVLNREEILIADKVLAKRIEQLFRENKSNDHVPSLSGAACLTIFKGLMAMFVAIHLIITTGITTVITISKDYSIKCTDNGNLVLKIKSKK
ncbi:MAG: hypothetical protein UIL36_08720 [Turicibacter sp.]|nr:hypothetical protein [Turicibacter sp.]